MSTISNFFLFFYFFFNSSYYFLQLNFANTEKLIPIPLPLSMFDAQVMKQHEDVTKTEDANNEEVCCVTLIHLTLPIESYFILYI